VDDIEIFANFSEISNHGLKERGNNRGAIDIFGRAGRSAKGLGLSACICGYSKKMR
jgi:hypothetical protein